MTLHVFANNERARSVYDRFGYSGELLRYVKRFPA
jgi:ribosomal protein S18 acetylase RimI-like enzyme